MQGPWSFVTGTASIPGCTRRGRALCHAGVLVLFGLLLAPAAFGVTIHVPSDQPTIRAGIQAAVFGDTVLVAPGTYYEHDLPMKSGICLRSESGEMTDTIIDAQGLGRVMACVSAGDHARIEGFTFTGGHMANDYGAGIFFRNASPTIARCRFTGNTAEPGGSAIYCASASPSFYQCVFGRNGQAIDGGCLNCSYASPVFTECLIYGNSAQIWGGAIFCQESSPALIRCTVVGNRAYQGGGIWCCADSHVILEDTIIASSLHGEGVYVYPDDYHPSEISLTCCDVYGNAGGNYGGDIQDQTGLNGNISASPLFCDPDSANFQLAAGSPCLPENNDCGVQMGAYGQGCDAPAGIAVGAPPADRPGAAILMDWSGPNPFRPGEEIGFRLAAPGEVSLTIFDVAGRSLRHLMQRASCPAGEQRVPWDGCDDAGQPVPRGVCFYRLEAGGSAGGAAILLLP